MSHELVTTLIVALITGPGGWGILQLWLNNKQKRLQEERDAKAAELERSRARQAQDSEVWYRESRHNYELAKKQALEARQECDECRRELKQTRTVVYTMLEEFEDQIFPMLSLPNVDHMQTGAAMRSIIRKARESL